MDDLTDGVSLLCARCLRILADKAYGSPGRADAARQADQAVTVIDGDTVCMMHAVEKIDLSRTTIARVKGRAIAAAADQEGRL